MNTANIPQISRPNSDEGSPNLNLDELLHKGMRLHQENQFDEAAAIYGEILALCPLHFNALHLLGVLRNQTGHPDEAIRLITAALEIQENAAAFLNRGLALSTLGRHGESLAEYDRAIALQPDYAEVFNVRGNSLKELNRADDALASYDRAIALNPDYAEAFNNRGTLLSRLKRHDEALSDFDRAILLRPEFPEAFNNRGNVLRNLKKSDESILSFDHAIGLKPNYVAALKNRITALSDQNRFEEALIDCDQILASQADDWDALYTRGNILGSLHRIDEALVSYRRAIALYRPEESMDSLEPVDAVRPTVADIYWNQGLLHLLAGDFEKGWQGYEWRWKKTGHRPTARNFSQPLWNGTTDLDGMTILLHGEQGLGDTIQFCRYAKHVADRGGRVLLEVPSMLTSVLHNLAGVAEIVVAGSALPHFDCHCPLLSLPLAFGTRLDSIPADVPYLEASPIKILRWSNRLGKGRSDALRVGLVWSGNPTHVNDRNRSMPLATLLHAIPPGVEIFSLQKEIRLEDRNTLRANKHVVNSGKLLKDFDDTAALISLMDVVISVDTAVAHLAGALGAKTWLLLPFVHDWRWLMNRNDSPWYPTMQMFRQPAYNDWDSVVASVNAALTDLSRENVGETMAGHDDG
ncbi:MAG: glycosyltransferase family 41 protein [Rhodospirillaceae bacterium]|nr:MAG: glycosyltransferase family 41 protein [Rhodospirillaceae bacterium]